MLLKPEVEEKLRVLLRDARCLEFEEIVWEIARSLQSLSKFVDTSSLDIAIELGPEDVPGAVRCLGGELRVVIEVSVPVKGEVCKELADLRAELGEDVALDQLAMVFVLRSEHLDYAVHTMKSWDPETRIGWIPSEERILGSNDIDAVHRAEAGYPTRLAASLPEKAFVRAIYAVRTSIEGLELTVLGRLGAEWIELDRIPENVSNLGERLGIEPVVELRLEPEC